MARQSHRQQKRQKRLSLGPRGEAFATNPINTAPAPIIVTLDELRHWLRLKDVNTVRKWHKKYGMPLHLDMSGRYIAFVAEVRIWLTHFNRIRTSLPGATQSVTKAREERMLAVSKLIEEVMVL